MGVWRHVWAPGHRITVVAGERNLSRVEKDTQMQIWFKQLAEQV